MYNALDNQETFVKADSMKSPLVSIIMPVYNAEFFLERSVSSVLSQEYNNLELILVDDGSSDSSAEICSRYASNVPKIKYFRQENKGPAAARNTGVKNSSGDFIYFLDADDFITEEAIAIMIDTYNSTKSDLIMTNFGKLIDDNKIVNQPVSFNKENIPFEGKRKILDHAEMNDYIRHFFKYPSNHLVSYCWARLYKRSIIDKFNISAHEDMKLFEDFVFNLEYMKHIDSVVFINTHAYIYVMHSNHVSASMDIFNGESLLHDMNIFKGQVTAFFKNITATPNTVSKVSKEVGHALVHYVIIFFVRSCRLLNKNNKKILRREIKTIVNAATFRDCLKCYTPEKGNSRLIPFLARLKLVDLIIYISHYKAIKRYGKPSGK